ncbi:hypothetical protein [Pseudomonas sp. R1-7]|uniref:hypothetical protein n=1 Tax=Pseudomonas sp. R1-7 TaxID=2817398 RepID=UPI003DA92EA9
MKLRTGQVRFLLFQGMAEALGNQWMGPLLDQFDQQLPSGVVLSIVRIALIDWDTVVRGAVNTCSTPTTLTPATIRIHLH